MNKKAFTLIELMAIIVILSVVSLMTVTVINDLLSKSKNNLSDDQIKNIERAAKEWALKNENETNNCIEITTLKNEGYLQDNIIDPKTKKEITGSVKITYKENLKQYEYKYDKNKCKE